VGAGREAPGRRFAQTPEPGRPPRPRRDRVTLCAIRPPGLADETEKAYSCIRVALVVASKAIPRTASTGHPPTCRAARPSATRRSARSTRSATPPLAWIAACRASDDPVPEPTTKTRRAA
jgi:hypothetical protein